MRKSLFVTAVLTTSVTAFECTVASLSKAIPANASINYAYTLGDNSTYQVDAGDLGFPSKPTGLQSLCVVNVHQLGPNDTTWNFGMFLPDGWNGRFLTVGGAGFGGGINFADMGVGANYGFAVVSSDYGHNSTTRDGTWGQNPQAVTNWGYLALHESIVLAKQITQSYYGKKASYNYYSGCSTGGRQGMKEIQMYPDEFDGVLAGAPAWWTNHLQLQNAYVGVVNLPVNSSHYISQNLWTVVSNEVLRQCDAQDGLVDTIISDPLGCAFDPWILLCSANATNTSACLSADQIGTFQKISSDWVTTNQTYLFAHYLFGSEIEMSSSVIGPAPLTLGTDYIKYFLGLGENWNWQTDWNTDELIALSERLNPGKATADHFDISPFQKRGGKLIHYHGLADGIIPTGSSIYLRNQYFKNMTAQGIDLESFYRFFLVPGLSHCRNTPTNQNAPWYFAGPNQAPTIGSNVHSVPGFEDSRHDVLLALMSWVENGTAPDEIIGTKWVNDALHDKVQRQRPICKYPYVASYVGKGDPDKAKNWACKMRDGTFLSQQ